MLNHIKPQQPEQEGNTPCCLFSAVVFRPTGQSVDGSHRTSSRSNCEVGGGDGGVDRGSAGGFTAKGG